MRSAMIVPTFALALAATATVASAAPAPVIGATMPPASAVVPAQYYYHRHYRHGRVPYYLRGFEDPGYAYHGNVNGCAEDLGYGRWEPCNRGR